MNNLLASPALKNGLLRLVLLAVGLVMLYPFLWMVSASLKPSDLVLQYPPKLIPEVFRFDNYVQVFKEIPFARYMLNSFIVAASVTVLSLLLHSMAGYALSCLEFPGREPIFIGILSTMMVPFYSIIVPLTILVRHMGWMDTYMGLILPWVPHAFGIFLLRQYYLTFPKELKEAATVDGSSPLGVFFRIAMPVSKPILSSLAVIFFITNWDRFLWPLLITSKPEMRVIQLGLVQFKGQYVVNWHLIMAASVIACLPTLILFIFLQNKIVQGIATTGIKG